MASRSKAAAMLQGKCPRCREGQIFSYPVASRPFGFNKMNERCPHCEVRLEPEPGFYQGAMYVSYAITVMCMVAVSLVLWTLGDFSEWVYVGVVIGVMFLLIPFNYRVSRIIYLYAFGGVKYDPRLST